MKSIAQNRTISAAVLILLISAAPIMGFDGVNNHWVASSCEEMRAQIEAYRKKLIRTEGGVGTPRFNSIKGEILRWCEREITVCKQRKETAIQQFGQRPVDALVSYYFVAGQFWSDPYEWEANCTEGLDPTKAERLAKELKIYKESQREAVEAVKLSQPELLESLTPPADGSDSGLAASGGFESGVSCDQWNTPDFFTQAGAGDISRCLESKDHNEKDGQGRTPMHLAALYGKPEVVAALADAGADPDALDGKGRTPLHLVAVLGNAPEAVTALVKAGANPDALDGKGRTPLEYGEQFSKTPAVVTALRITKGDADMSMKAENRVSCEKWNTPDFFSIAGPEDLTRCLDTSDPNARNENGRTPMHYAAQGTSPALVTILAKAGARLNVPDERGGWTPLHLAAWFSTSPSVVAALLAAGADPGAVDKKGNTPWDYAQSNTALEGTPPYWRLSEEQAE